MQATDIATIIVLFLLFDIMFYLVIIKGMMVKSIIGKDNQPSRRLNKDDPNFLIQFLRCADAEQETNKQAVVQSLGSIHTEYTSRPFTPMDIVSRELDLLSLEKIDFYPPEELMVGIPVKLTAEVCHDITASIKDSLNQIIPNNIKTLKIGGSIRAEIFAPGFQVTALNDHEQQLSQENNRWTWEVMPLKAGKRNMGIHLNIKIKIPAGEQIKSFAWPGSTVYITANAYYTMKVFLKKNKRFMLISLGCLATLSAYLWFFG